jgi:hypothetical protein
MEFDFTQAMQNASDEELIKILTVDRDGYQEDAVKEAEIELKKRNISTEAFETSKKNHEKTRKTEIEKANAPLDNASKILTFFFPVIIQKFLSAGLREDGYDRKAAELTKWTFLGLGFYLLIFLLFSC